MLQGKLYNALKIDIWSCGITLYAIICGYLPFEDPNTANLYKKIIAGNFTMPNFLSENSKNLLQRILNVDPAKRANLEEIKASSFLKEAQEYIYETGIIYGQDNIEVDYDIIEYMDCFNFKREKIIEDVINHKHNQITATYYLLKSKNFDFRNADLPKVSISSNAIDASFNSSIIASTRSISNPSKIVNEIEVSKENMNNSKEKRKNVFLEKLLNPNKLKLPSLNASKEFKKRISTEDSKEIELSHLANKDKSKDNMINFVRKLSNTSVNKNSQKSFNSQKISIQIKRQMSPKPNFPPKKNVSLESQPLVKQTAPNIKEIKKIHILKKIEVDQKPVSKIESKPLVAPVKRFSLSNKMNRERKLEKLL